jgi:hypothetical protein
MWFFLNLFELIFKSDLYYSYKYKIYESIKYVIKQSIQLKKIIYKLKFTLNLSDTEWLSIFLILSLADFIPVDKIYFDVKFCLPEWNQLLKNYNLE